MRVVLLLAVLAGAAAVLVVGQALVRPDLPLIGEAAFSPARIRSRILLVIMLPPCVGPPWAGCGRRECIQHAMGCQAQRLG